MVLPRARQGARPVRPGRRRTVSWWRQATTTPVWPRAP